MAEEVTNGKRGRVALTPEQKAVRQGTMETYHGLGEHSISTVIKCTAKERAILRSYCKSLNKPFFGTGELLSGVLRKILLGYDSNIIPDAAAMQDEYIRNCAAKYDAENESPEVLACKKEIAKYENVAAGYRAKDQKVPVAVSGIIEFHKAQLAEFLPDYLAVESSEDNDEDETTEESE